MASEGVPRALDWNGESSRNLQNLSDEEALIFAYQLLGAVNYFLISPATLSGTFGKDIMQRISTNFSIELDSLITAKIQAAGK